MQYFGDFYIADIESSHIAEYRKLRLQQKAKNHDKLVSPATVNREVILLKSMLKKAAEWYGLTLRTITLDLGVGVRCFICLKAARRFTVSGTFHAL